METKMNIWRIKLNPKGLDGVDLNDYFHFCVSRGEIGVGWADIDTNIASEIKQLVQERCNNEKHALTSINALSKMKTRDLIWTSFKDVYYLCQVGDKLWKDRVVTANHRKHDLGQFVSVDWQKIGTDKDVPPVVVSHLNVQPAVPARRINNIEDISKHIWNSKCAEKCYNDIGSSLIECLRILK